MSPSYGFEKCSAYKLELQATLPDTVGAIYNEKILRDFGDDDVDAQNVLLYVLGVKSEILKPGFDLLQITTCFRHFCLSRQRLVRDRLDIPPGLLPGVLKNKLLPRTCCDFGFGHEITGWS